MLQGLKVKYLSKWLLYLKEESNILEEHKLLIIDIGSYTRITIMSYLLVLLVVGLGWSPATVNLVVHRFHTCPLFFCNLAGQ